MTTHTLLSIRILVLLREDSADLQVTPAYSLFQESQGQRWLLVYVLKRACTQGNTSNLEMPACISDVSLLCNPFWRLRYPGWFVFFLYIVMRHTFVFDVCWSFKIKKGNFKIKIRATSAQCCWTCASVWPKKGQFSPSIVCMCSHCKILSIQQGWNLP